MRLAIETISIRNAIELQFPEEVIKFLSGSITCPLRATLSFHQYVTKMYGSLRSYPHRPLISDEHNSRYLQRKVIPFYEYKRPEIEGEE